jgi:predicted outer membrane repeat protein
MLSAAAVGSFQRTGGDLLVSAAAQAAVPTGSVSDLPSPSSNEVFDHITAAALAQDENGMAQAVTSAEAACLTPIGNSITVPQVTSATINILNALGAHATGANVEPTTSARGIFQYVPDPDITENLLFHGHLFIAAYGGFVEVGSGQVDGFVNAGAEIADNWISGTLQADGTWLITGDGPNIGPISLTAGSLNFHVHFVTPFVGGEIDFLAAGRSLASAAANGDSAGLIVQTAAGAWGFATVQGQNLTSGDLDADGNVDGADFQIWADGDPRADVAPAIDLGGGVTQFDGIVDEQDYAVWAATADAILVSTNVDENDGNYSYGDLSLREAIALAADVNHPGSDIIAFDGSLLGDTLTLSSELTIANGNDFQILGPGADHLTISGNSQTRVFKVLNGTSVTLHGLTITGGEVNGSNDGAAIRNGGDLTVESVVLSQNSSGRLGGAIYSTNKLRVVNSTFTDNDSLSGGGAIAIQTNIPDALIVENSTFFDNESTDGGAIRMHGSNGAGTARITNSTFSGNTASNNGGAIRLTSVAPDLTIVNTTITGNHAPIGGGIRVGGGSITMFNTIVSGNTATATADNDIHGAIASSSDYNLFGIGEQGAQSGTHNVWDDDPRLTPLGDHGGRTKTHALLFDSLAIDAGDNDRVDEFDFLFDQRGDGFDRIVDWDYDSDARVDIGAFEVALGKFYT